MSSFLFCNWGISKNLKISHLNGFFFVVNEFNRDDIRLYTNYMVYKAFSKIFKNHPTLYEHDPRFIKGFFKEIASSYAQGNSEKI